jgi:hypothetical protein
MMASDQPMTSIPYDTPAEAHRLPFKDRRTSLTVLGVILLVLGGVCGCFGAATPIGMFIAATVPQVPSGWAVQSSAPSVTATTTELDVRSMVFILLMYAILAAILIGAGIGAVRVRRWVRPVVLIFSWSWLVTGGIGLVFWLLGGPSMRQILISSVPAGAPRPPVVVYYAIAWGAGILMTLLMVALPAFLLWAFRRRGMRETLEFFDPRTRWTDACPTPVLAVSAWLVLAAAGCLLYCLYAVLPVFGLVIGGLAALAGLILLAVVFAWLAWQTYRLRLIGWWGTLLVLTFWGASVVWTFSRVGWAEFYRKAGYSPRQVEPLMRYSAGYESGMLWMVALWSIALVVYLLCVRKYFTRDRNAPPARPTGS